MLTIILGPNGSGKSLFAVHQVIRELLRGNRPVVTSLSIDPGKLNEYLHTIAPDNPPDVLRRLLVIGPEQQRFFWRYRGLYQDRSKIRWDISDGLPRSHPTPAPIILGPYGDETWTSQKIESVFYVLDELQTTFTARDFQKNGTEFCAYQAQHRHFGDDVIGITPASGLIDKQFRVLAGECVVLCNRYKLAKGILRAPKDLQWRSYQNCPPAPGEDHMQKGSLKIDPHRIASLYNTAAGLGVVGAQADQGKHARGIPWWTIFPAGLLLGLLAWYLSSGIVGGTFRWGLRKIKVSQSPPQTNAIALPLTSATIPLLAASKSAIPSASTATTNALRWTAYAHIHGVFQIALSNGKIIERARGVSELDGKLFVPGFGWLDRQDFIPDKSIIASSPSTSVEPRSQQQQPESFPVRSIRVIDGKTGKVIGQD